MLCYKINDFDGYATNEAGEQNDEEVDWIKVSTDMSVHSFPSSKTISEVNNTDNVVFYENNLIYKDTDCNNIFNNIYAFFPLENECLSSFSKFLLKNYEKPIKEEIIANYDFSSHSKKLEESNISRINTCNHSNSCFPSFLSSSSSISSVTKYVDNDETVVNCASNSVRSCLIKDLAFFFFWVSKSSSLSSFCSAIDAASATFFSSSPFFSPSSFFFSFFSSSSLLCIKLFILSSVLFHSSLSSRSLRFASSFAELAIARNQPKRKKAFILCYKRAKFISDRKSTFFNIYCNSCPCFRLSASFLHLFNFSFLHSLRSGFFLFYRNSSIGKRRRVWKHCIGEKKAPFLYCKKKVSKHASKQSRKILSIKRKASIATNKKIDYESLLSCHLLNASNFPYFSTRSSTFPCFLFFDGFTACNDYSVQEEEMLFSKNKYFNEENFCAAIPSSLLYSSSSSYIINASKTTAVSDNFHSRPMCLSTSNTYADEEEFAKLDLTDEEDEQREESKFSLFSIDSQKIDNNTACHNKNAITNNYCLLNSSNSNNNLLYQKKQKDIQTTEVKQEDAKFLFLPSLEINLAAQGTIDVMPDNVSLSHLSLNSSASVNSTYEHSRSNSNICFLDDSISQLNVNNFFSYPATALYSSRSLNSKDYCEEEGEDSRVCFFDNEMQGKAESKCLKERVEDQRCRDIETSSGVLKVKSIEAMTPNMSSKNMSVDKMRRMTHSRNTLSNHVIDHATSNIKHQGVDSLYGFDTKRYKSNIFKNVSNMNFDEKVEKTRKITENNNMQPWYMPSAFSCKKFPFNNPRRRESRGEAQNFVESENSNSGKANLTKEQLFRVSKKKVKRNFASNFNITSSSCSNSLFSRRKSFFFAPNAFDSASNTSNKCNNTPNISSPYFVHSKKKVDFRNKINVSFLDDQREIKVNANQQEVVCVSLTPKALNMIDSITDASPSSTSPFFSSCFISASSVSCEASGNVLIDMNCVEGKRRSVSNSSVSSSFAGSNSKIGERSRFSNTCTKESAEASALCVNNNDSFINSDDFLWIVKKRVSELREMECKKKQYTAHFRAERRYERRSRREEEEVKGGRRGAMDDGGVDVVENLPLKEEDGGSMKKYIDSNESDNGVEAEEKYNEENVNETRSSSESSVDSIKGIVNGSSNLRRMNMCENPSDLWYGLKTQNGKPVEVYRNFVMNANNKSSALNRQKSKRNFKKKKTYNKEWISNNCRRNKEVVWMQKHRRVGPTAAVSGAAWQKKKNAVNLRADVGASGVNDIFKKKQKVAKSDKQKKKKKHIRQSELMQKSRLPPSAVLHSNSKFFGRQFHHTKHKNNGATFFSLNRTHEMKNYTSSNKCVVHRTAANAKADIRSKFRPGYYANALVADRGGGGDAAATNQNLQIYNNGNIHSGNSNCSNNSNSIGNGASSNVSSNSNNSHMCYQNMQASEAFFDATQVSYHKKQLNYHEDTLCATSSSNSFQKYSSSFVTPSSSSSFSISSSARTVFFSNSNNVANFNPTATSQQEDSKLSSYVAVSLPTKNLDVAETSNFFASNALLPDLPRASICSNNGKSKAHYALQTASQTRRRPMLQCASAAAVFKHPNISYSVENLKICAANPTDSFSSISPFRYSQMKSTANSDNTKFLSSVYSFPYTPENAFNSLEESSLNESYYNNTSQQLHHTNKIKENCDLVESSSSQDGFSAIANHRSFSANNFSSASSSLIYLKPSSSCCNNSLSSSFSTHSSSVCCFPTSSTSTALSHMSRRMHDGPAKASDDHSAMSSIQRNECRAANSTHNNFSNSLFPVKRTKRRHKSRSIYAGNNLSSTNNSNHNNNKSINFNHYYNYKHNNFNSQHQNNYHKTTSSKNNDLANNSNNNVFGSNNNVRRKDVKKGLIKHQQIMKITNDEQVDQSIQNNDVNFNLTSFRLNEKKNDLANSFKYLNAASSSSASSHLDVRRTLVCYRDLEENQKAEKDLSISEKMSLFQDISNENHKSSNGLLNIVPNTNDTNTNNNCTDSFFSGRFSASTHLAPSSSNNNAQNFLFPHASRNGFLATSASSTLSSFSASALSSFSASTLSSFSSTSFFPSSYLCNNSVHFRHHQQHSQSSAFDSPLANSYKTVLDNNFSFCNQGDNATKKESMMIDYSPDASSHSSANLILYGGVNTAFSRPSANNREDKLLNKDNRSRAKIKRMKAGVVRRRINEESKVQRVQRLLAERRGLLS